MERLKRPYILIKTAMSLDGCIDDLSPKRLILSSPEDMQAVDLLKSTFDAVLVGAETVRRDNPSLLIKSEENRAARRAAGLAEDPVKVTLTNQGDLNPESRFFQNGANQKIVYCPQAKKSELEKKLGKVAVVVGLQSSPLQVEELVADLYQRGISRLFVEGGGKINQLFLKAGIVDALRIAVAPFFVSEPDAPRVVASGNEIKAVPQNQNSRMKLDRVEILGDVAALFYSLKTKTN